jgi:hypothetical protein
MITLETLSYQFTKNAFPVREIFPASYNRESHQRGKWLLIYIQRIESSVAIAPVTINFQT